MSDSTATEYRGHQIIYHEDAGHIITLDHVVLFTAATLEEARAWVDTKMGKPNANRE